LVRDKADRFRPMICYASTVPTTIHFLISITCEIAIQRTGKKNRQFCLGSGCHRPENRHQTGCAKLAQQALSAQTPSPARGAVSGERDIVAGRLGRPAPAVSSRALRGVGTIADAPGHRPQRRLGQAARHPAPFGNGAAGLFGQGGTRTLSRRVERRRHAPEHIASLQERQRAAPGVTGPVHRRAGAGVFVGNDHPAHWPKWLGRPAAAHVLVPTETRLVLERSPAAPVTSRRCCSSSDPFARAGPFSCTAPCSRTPCRTRSRRA